MSQPPVSRAGFQDFLGEFQRHLVQLREEGVRAIEADPALVRKLGQPPALPVPAAAAARAPAAGPERWMLAARKPSGGAPVLWRICADEASFAGDAGQLMRSILAAAGFELAGEPSIEAPAAASLTLAFGMRAFQTATGNPRAPFDRSRGQVVEGGGGRVIGTYAPPDLLPNNVPLKKAVWADIKAGLAACGLEAPAR